jgi:hypothetical protein
MGAGFWLEEEDSGIKAKVGERIGSSDHSSR